MPPGFESPYHAHSKEDEAFYVIERRIDLLAERVDLTFSTLFTPVTMACM